MESRSQRLLRLPEVLHRLGIKKSSWYSGVKAGRYPAPRKLGPRVSVWPEGEIDNLVQEISRGE
jgi:prophage regulatory protein